MVRAIVVLPAVALIAGLAGAQPGRDPITAAKAQQLEAALVANPSDRAARAGLLDYYFLNPELQAAQAVQGRRRHILWLIENTPGDSLAGGPSATIDAAGHRLADAQGYKLASAAWRAQAEKPDATAGALTNAAYFFKLSDKGFAIGLLERAIALEPGNKEFGARLGDQYALAIMGVTMINKSGFPLGADAGEIQGPAAARAREALTTSRNPYALAKAGYMLTFQGTILRSTGKIGFDTTQWADYAMKRAVSLAPGDREVAAFAAEQRALQEQVRAAGKR